MKSVDDVTKAISRFEIQGNRRLDERVRGGVYGVFGEVAVQVASERGLRRWREIAGSRTAQLAAAAIIAVAALVGLHAWEFTGAEAYAVTQTIEALRTVETSHAFCTSWDGRKFETWTRPDPMTRANDFICVIEPQYDCTVISTPGVSYYYYPGRNLVRIVRGQLITSSRDIAAQFESLVSEAEKKGDSVQIGRETNTRFGDVIFLHYTGAQNEYKAWIDPKTKLWLGMEYIRTSVSGEMVKSIEEIRYNEPVPDRWLHFQCPDDAEIRPEGWGPIDDPNCGIDVSGLSEEHACSQILTDLFEAVNRADMARIRKLIPFAGSLDDPALAAAVYESLGSLWDDPRSGLGGYEIGSPYRDRACPLGVLVPCVLSDHQGRRFGVTFIVRFRKIEGRDSCVVVFTWGKARRIEE